MRPDLPSGTVTLLCTDVGGVDAAAERAFEETGVEVDPLGRRDAVRLVVALARCPSTDRPVRLSR
jgi:hypothetical protein